MPYVTRETDQTITLIHSTEAFTNEEFDVSSVQYSGNVVTLTLSSAQTMAESKLTRAIVSGAGLVEFKEEGKPTVHRDVFNGKFTVTRISDTQFSYVVNYSDVAQPTGNMKIKFAMEYLANDDPEILAIKQKDVDFETLKLKKQALCADDCKVTRHYEEVCANATTTMTQTEFETLHSARETLRSEIAALEAKLGI